MQFVSGLRVTRQSPFDVQVNRQTTTPNWQHLKTPQSNKDWNNPRPFIEKSYMNGLQYKKYSKPVHIIANTIAEPPNSTSTDESDGSTRHLTTAEEDDVYITQISYPIEEGTSCACVTFPDEDPHSIDDCDVGITWGSFQIYFSETECVNLQFDETTVYEYCQSDDTQSDEYVLCVINFTDEDSSDPLSVDGSTASQSSTDLLAETEAIENSQASMSNSPDGDSASDYTSENPSSTPESSQYTTDQNDMAPSTTSSSAYNPAKTAIRRVLSLVVVAALLLQ